MLLEQTFDKLTALQLHGMVEALHRFADTAPAPDIGPTHLVGLLADAESTYRDNRKLQIRLRQAKLRQQACIEDIDYRHPRGLSKSLVLDLASSNWVARHQHIIITGKTGVGKSFLACALAHKACRDGYTVTYRRFSRLLDELTQARADGTYLAALRRFAKTRVVVLDDFGLEPLGPNDRRILLDLLEARYALASTIITSQLEPDLWHGVIGDETAADSICDRLVHEAHRIKLSGEPVRKTTSSLKKEAKSAK
jgi:DNA replication protein DnaC